MISNLKILNGTKVTQWTFMESSSHALLKWLFPWPKNKISLCLSHVLQYIISLVSLVASKKKRATHHVSYLYMLTLHKVSTNTAERRDWSLQDFSIQAIVTWMSEFPWIKICSLFIIWQDVFLCIHTHVTTDKW